MLYSSADSRPLNMKLVDPWLCKKAMLSGNSLMIFSLGTLVCLIGGSMPRSLLIFIIPCIVQIGNLLPQYL